MNENPNGHPNGQPNVPGDQDAAPGPGLGGDLPPSNVAPSASSAYRVLARTYRPQSFADLVGQEAMVRTLSNAFAAGRIAHAFLLTGVRGIGKTTTARIIAKALNCQSAPGPTMTPCGTCESCVAITASRHMDVMEMDAASRTGIGDIRELIDGVNYLPASARYKVYIIDEVHMLSNAAFNGLLKTLEEPPAHVKFIFATTELRKIPITVLSRCQRFDLKRLDPQAMSDHLARIAAKEDVVIEPEALALIARAAEGSVRDGLSLLDQAIAYDAGKIEAVSVRAMLGLSDRTRVFDLLGLIMSGEIAKALDEVRAQYDAGSEPQAILRDLLDLTHLLTRLKIAPEAIEDAGLAEGERARARDLSARLAMPILARAWQMLLKGFGEVREAPNPIAAAEMVIIRLAYVTDLPTPGDLVRQLKDQGASPAPRAMSGSAPQPAPVDQRVAMGSGANSAPQPAPRTQEGLARAPESLEALANLAGLMRDVSLKYQIENDIHLSHFEIGRIEFRPGPKAPPTLAGDLAARLLKWTGERWMVSITNAAGAPSLAAQRRDRDAAAKAEIRHHPLVAEALAAFPGADIIELREFGAQEAPVPETDEDLSLVESALDPYEEAMEEDL